MGRTLRQRSRKEKCATSLSSDASFIRLTRWMSSKGWRQSSALCLTKFTDTGRGLMAKQSIQRGDILASIPMSLLITTATACNSAVGLLLSSKLSTVESFLCQEVLASFLLWEKHLGNTSLWEHVSYAVELIQSCFSHLLPFFENSKCDHCQCSALEIFKWDEFLWSWCCVNTRAVFIEPEYVPIHSLPLKDRNCLALAPFLDMFNHSDTAKVKVSLNKSSDCYEIVTLQTVSKFKEVFINYGPHSNSKLFLEYGFLLPSNVHDTVPFEFLHIKEAFKLAGLTIQYEYDKIKFCKRHNLISQLHISESGFSWNCLTLLKILLSSSADIKSWEEISFKAIYDASTNCDTNFNRIKQLLISTLKINLASCQPLLLQKCDRTCCAPFKDGGKNPTLEMCWTLLQSLLSILDTADNLVDRSSL